MEIESKKQIQERQEEIKKEIVEMLKETSSYFELEDVLNVVYNENESDDFQHILMMFDDGNPENFSNALELVGDVWNYFPHKALGGISPAEKVLKYNQENK